MARPLDDQQRQELRAFAEGLYSLAGYTSAAQWERDSGVEHSTVSRFRNGTGGIDGYNLLRLIRAASARVQIGGERQSPEQAAVAAAGDPVLHLLEALAGNVNRLLSGQTALLREAGIELAEPEPAEPEKGPGHARRQSGRDAPKS